MKKIVYFLRKISKKSRGKPDIIRRFAVWLCEKSGGHEASPTKQGYMGGNMLDTWCKHCDHMYQIPVSEVDISDDFRKLMSLIGKPI